MKDLVMSLSNIGKLDSYDACIIGKYTHASFVKGGSRKGIE